MNKKDALAAVQKIKADSKKRNFLQSIEMMVNFTGLNMTKPQNQVNIKVILPHSTGKGSGKIAVFAKTDEFAAAMKDKVNLLINEKEIEAFSKNKQKVAELITYDSIFAEGSVMLTVAKFLGPQLAPKGKMPKPIMNVKSFDETLAQARTQVTISNKKGKFMPVVHTVVGKEDMKDEEVVENMIMVYESVRDSLPQKKQNIKNIYLKMTMGAPVKIGDLQ